MLWLVVLWTACGDSSAAGDSAESAETGSTGQEATTSADSPTSVDPDAGTSVLPDDTTSSGSSSSASSSSASSSSDGTSSTSDTSSTSETEDSTTGPAPVGCDIDLGNDMTLEQMGDTAMSGNDVPAPTALECSNHLGWDGNDIVYAWEAPVAGWYEFTVLTQFDNLVLALYDGCDSETLLECARNNVYDDGSRAAVELAAGQQVAILVDDLHANNPEAFTLVVQPLPSCDAPIDLASELVVDLPGTVAGALDEVAPSCQPDPTAEDVVYSWAAPEDGVYTASITDPAFEGAIAVFRGLCNDPEAEVGCERSTGGTAALSFPALQGEVLSLVVDAAVGSGTDFLLDIALTGATAGDCCSTHAGGACEDFAAAACTCDITDECCDESIGWIEGCVGIAGGQCGACPPVDPGDCCDEHPTATCSEVFVMNCVCEVDPSLSCCAGSFFEGSWDAWCIQLAENYCNVECP